MVAAAYIFSLRIFDFFFRTSISLTFLISWESNRTTNYLSKKCDFISAIVLDMVAGAIER